MSQNRVFIVDGARTPFLKARGTPGAFSAADLAVAAGRPLLARMPFEADQLDEVILGCVIAAADEANIARIVSLRLGCGSSVPAYTVHRNCGSGLQAIANAAERIEQGRAHLVLAGGTEAMSRAPVQWNTAMTAWLAGVTQAHGRLARWRQLLRFRSAYLKPVYALALGLSDPLVRLSMGQTAEVLAHRFAITREMQDSFAVQSHRRLAAWYDAGHAADEVEVLYEPSGKFYTEDTGLRRDTDATQLARLKPAFDRKYGQVTSGNASQVTDGAAWVLLASADAVRRYQLPVLGEWFGHEWAGVDPRQMGLGPVQAVARLLTRHRIAMRDIEQMELNEAFAAQVLACQAAWDSAEYAREELGLDAPLGAMDPDRLNPEGGAIACGHPVGASGARLVLHLLRSLKRKGRTTGVATICIGGGQGGAMLLRAAEGVA